ncbi:MAG: PilN domain-containing protein [Candidatus Marinimicrobia bacterium]|nr:PilN domain-containing protein [Candidatus Neomarinimicrobiota bacterium]
MFGKNKSLTINNTGTKIQSILGHLGDNGEINIEQINSVNMGPQEMVEDRASTKNMMTGEQSFSAEEVLASSGAERETESKDIESLLLETFADINEKKLDLGINIPSRFIKSIFIDRDFSEVKASQKDQQVKKEINSRLERPVSSEHYDYIDTAENKVIGFTYEGRPPFLNIYDRISDVLGIKTRIKTLLPDEIALANLINYNYEPEPEEIIAVVHIDSEYSQLIITKGGELLHVSHAINIPIKSPDLINKISGRLLYEKDLNNIEDFSRIVITGMGVVKQAKQKLEKKLTFESSVEYLSLDQDKFTFLTEVRGDVSEIGIPIGILVTILNEQKPHQNTVDLIPEYIKEKQTFFKLSWYNLFILFLLFLSPIYLGYRYSKVKNEYFEVKQEYEGIQNKIENIKAVQAKRKALLEQIKQTEAELEKVKDISENNYQLSKSLDKIKKAIRKEGGIWLDNVNFNREKITITGYAVYRNRPPRFVANFADASLENITRTEIRGKPVYKFQIVISEVYEDTKVYNPQIKNSN